MSNEFSQFLAENGIRRELTHPNSPQQNGVAERFNRTLFEMARSLLHHAGLETSFWAEALKTAVYIRNRSPTRALIGQTPYEAWHGTKPDLSHMRVFGSKAYAQIPTGDGGHHHERGGIGNATGRSARARPISTWCSRGGRQACSSGGAIAGGACADLTRPSLWASRLGRMQSSRLVSGRA